jgi:hypothetical protein
VKGVTRVTSSRNPPLVTVDDDLVSLGVELDRSANVGGVGTCDTLLSHGERRTSFSFEERLEPLFLLSGVTVTSENLWKISKRVRAEDIEFEESVDDAWRGLEEEQTKWRKEKRKTNPCFQCREQKRCKLRGQLESLYP